MSFRPINEAPIANEAVRDLQWILRGPSLLDPLHPELRGKLVSDLCYDAHWFKALDARPEPLLRYLEETLKAHRYPRSGPRPERPLLGRYFEALLGFWIREYLKPALFFSGVPVHAAESSDNGRKTLGEFDFLFRRVEAGETCEHWEAAIKFYLFAGNTPEEAKDPRFFVGAHNERSGPRSPRPRDRLDRKIERLISHQLNLSDSDEGRAKLAALGLGWVRSRAWVRGALFYPSRSFKDVHFHPDFVSPEHWRGWWTVADPLVLPTSRTGRWVLLPKRRWISPAFVEEDSARMSRASCARQRSIMSEAEMRAYCHGHFSGNGSPLMWAEVSSERAGLWQEIQRGMVVHADWPKAARQAAEERFRLSEN